MRQTFDETTDPSFGARHLPLVRAAMAEQGLDGFLVPHEDEHQNEYLPEANDRLAWLTGFTGSAGAGVVMKDRAAVFTDGRYTVQVKAQVDAGQFELRDFVEGGVPAYLEQAPKGAVIGYDPRLHSPDALATLRRAAARAGAELKPVEANPVDLAWGPADRAGRAASRTLCRREQRLQARPHRRGRRQGGGRRRRADRARFHRLAVQCAWR
jgi:Xaa-Pro aminopeptidase